MQKLTIVNAILFLFFAITALAALVLLETQKRMTMFSGALAFVQDNGVLKL